MMKKTLFAAIAIVLLSPVDISARQMGHEMLASIYNKNAEAYCLYSIAPLGEKYEYMDNQKCSCSQMLQSDRAYFGLKGKVESITIKAQNRKSTTVKFSVDGKMEEKNGKPFDECYRQSKRDSLGRITFLELTNKKGIEPKSYASRTLKYDELGRLSLSSHKNSKGETNIVYSYNGSDIKPSSVRKYVNREGKNGYSIAYRYLSADEQGNWTKCECTNSKRETWMEERIVSYHEASGVSQSDSVLSKKYESKLYVDSDTPPQYPGGNKALLDFVNSNLRYPSSCLKKGIQGRVILRFLVEEGGSIGEIKVIKGLHKDIEKEAIRVVRLMKNFQPATSIGQPKKAWVVMPISFVMP